MGAELFDVDERTDGQAHGQTDRTKIIVPFCDFLKAPKNCNAICSNCNK